MDYRKQLIETISVQVRPRGDSPAEQLLKFKHHTEANDTLKLYISKKQYLSAYTVAFSLLEDRLRAMAIVKERDLLGGDDYQKFVTLGIAKVISFAYERTTDNLPLIQNLKNVAINRNKLLHEAMWRIDAISPIDIEHLMKLRALVANDLAKMKRKIPSKK
ncbi:MAG: hypothetical protein WAO82_06365 [Limnohabitans sp.]|jgi:hypothetical protein